MEGSDGTCKDTEDTTMLVQLEEAKCDIRKMSYVTKLSPVRAVADKGRGWQVSLSCSRCQEYGSCHKKQEPTVRLSREHRTELACLQELLKRLQDRHVECAQAVATKAATDAASAAPVRHTHDDAGDAHEVLAEVDNWDLSVHRREATPCKTVVTCKSGLARINRHLTQVRTVS